MVFSNSQCLLIGSKSISTSLSRYIETKNIHGCEGQRSKGRHQGVTKRFRLSWLTNSALRIWAQMRGEGGGGVAGSQPMTPYLAYDHHRGNALKSFSVLRRGKTIKRQRRHSKTSFHTHLSLWLGCPRRGPGQRRQVLRLRPRGLEWWTQQADPRPQGQDALVPQTPAGKEIKKNVYSVWQKEDKHTKFKKKSLSPL